VREDHEPALPARASARPRMNAAVGEGH